MTKNEIHKRIQGCDKTIADNNFNRENRLASKAIKERQKYITALGEIEHEKWLMKRGGG